MKLKNKSMQKVYGIPILQFACTWDISSEACIHPHSRRGTDENFRKAATTVSGSWVRLSDG